MSTEANQETITYKMPHFPELEKYTIQTGTQSEGTQEIPAPLGRNDETKKDAQYLLEEIQFPPEFYPGIGWGRQSMWKVDPLPFLRLKDDIKKIVFYNSKVLSYEVVSFEEAGARIENWYNIPNTRGGGNQSRAERALRAIASDKKQVSYCGKVAGFEGGVYETCGGELIVVPSTKRILEAAASQELPPLKEGELPYFEKWKPLWDEVFRPLLVNPETGDPVQFHLFCQLLAAARAIIGSAYDAKIPALAIVGKKGTGKTLLSSIYAKILAVDSADPTSYLYGDTQFNSHLVGVPLWVVDDKELREQKTAHRFKDTIVGGFFQISAKGIKEQPIVYPVFALAVMANDTLSARKTVPIIDETTRDKIILFKAYEGGMPERTRDERWGIIKAALPYFAAYLDNYVWPSLDKTKRCIPEAWQNPEMERVIFTDTEAGQLHGMFQTLFEEQPGESGEAHTAHEWIRLLEDCEETRRGVDNICYTPERLGWKISTLAEKFPGLYNRVFSSDKRHKRLIRIQKE